VIFQEKTELTGFFNKAGFILENSDVIPELFEKSTISSVQSSSSAKIQQAQNRIIAG
jgi:hypothetical protein